jgi:hypothetical protein
MGKMDVFPFAPECFFKELQQTGKVVCLLDKRFFF